MKPGPKPKGKVVTFWSREFAYAVGLLTADGCLSKDGRHIDFTSKDREQVAAFRRCLKLKAKIGTKRSGAGLSYFRIQFSDVLFYLFLESIGLSSAKSKTISHVRVPDEYFADFLRGYFDGDGTVYSFYDSVFPRSYRFYISFLSASPRFIYWLGKKMQDRVHVKGHLSSYTGTNYLQLRFSKKEAIIVAEFMYYKKSLPFLKRKYLKIQKSMHIIKSRLSGEIGKHAAFRSQFPQGIGGSSPLSGTH